MPGHRLTLEADLAEIPRLIDWVERRCGDAGIVGDVPFRLTLALEEAVANAIRHAFVDRPPPHRIEVRLDADAQRAVATVTDNGRPFDPSAAPEPDLSLPLEARDPGGLGILLMHRMVDRVEYRRAGGHNYLRLEKSRG